jgi:hypothetical protein
MSRPTLANLEKRLSNAEAQARRLMTSIWVLPMSETHRRTPHLTGEYATHTNLVTRVIPNLRRQIARRREANAARGGAARARGRRLARQAGRHWRARTMRPPSGRGNAGGVTYRRIAAQTNVGNAISNSLRRQLTRLRNARDSGNRGNMMNIYSNMENNWKRAGGIRGANVMNTAQVIMFRAKLL